MLLKFRFAEYFDLGVSGPESARSPPNHEIQPILVKKTKHIDGFVSKPRKSLFSETHFLALVDICDDFA